VARADARDSELPGHPCQRDHLRQAFMRGLGTQELVVPTDRHGMGVLVHLEKVSHPRELAISAAVLAP
jgi:hypothetical protein